MKQESRVQDNPTLTPSSLIPAPKGTEFWLGEQQGPRGAHWGVGTNPTLCPQSGNHHTSSSCTRTERNHYGSPSPHKASKYRAHGSATTKRHQL